MTEPRTVHVLNLGAGVQSTTVHLMIGEGLLPPVEASLFADTQEEPAAVYAHLEWLKTRPGPRIHTGTAGKLGDDLARGVNSTGQRFASIPAFTAPHHDAPARRTGCNVGRTRRQCTREYKVRVCEQMIRRVVLGLKPRSPVPRNVRVIQWYGISDDEGSRRRNIVARHRDSVPWSTPRFPLCELGMTRQDCIDWLRPRVPHPVIKSACVFCPFRSSAEWWALKIGDPVGWARAVEIDELLRAPGTIANRNCEQSLYLHRLALPLAEIDFEKLAADEARRGKQPDMFRVLDCGEGMCGV